MKRIDLAFGKRKLQNGLTALAVRNRGVATMTACVAVRAGRLQESPGEHGLAHLVGACLDEGTRKHTAVQLAEEVENLGGYLNAGSGSVAIHCPAEESGKAVRILREVTTEPAFAAKDVRRVQQEILADIERELAEPYEVARRRFHALVYGDHPYGRSPMGLPTEVDAFKRADLQRFHRRWFVPEGGYVAIAGPADVDESLDLLAKTFRSLRGKRPAETVPLAPAMLDRKVDEHIEMDREQVHVFAGHPGIRRNHEDYYGLLVMDHILGSGPGFTSRIPKRLRDEMGLCYSVHSDITDSAGVEPGVFNAYIGTSAKHRRKALAGFVEEIRRMRDEPPTASEVDDVKEYLTGSFVLGLERNANLVSFAIRAERFGLGFDYIERFPELVRAITGEDVQRVARTHLDPTRLAVVSAGPAQVRSRGKALVAR